MSVHQILHIRPQSPPRRQRACLPCTKAKARCHYEKNEIRDGCDRCRRLAVTCTPQTTKSLRRPRQIKVKTIIEPIHASSGRDEDPWIPVADPENGLLIAGIEPNVVPAIGSGHVRSQGQDNGIPYHSKPPSLKSSTTSLLPPSPGFGITWDQAEQAIVDFTIIFTAHFPFIILEHNITARRLFVRKPLLFRAIMLIAIDFTSAKTREIKRSINAWIGQHLMVKGSQDIGALQGLIVYITWSNPQFFSDRRATQLIYLAVGLAHNIGITRLAVPGDALIREGNDINVEHRTFLACYYILSINSSQFGRPNPLSSGYVQYCVESLERSSEVATDFLLIKLVKFRNFVEQIPTIYQGLDDVTWSREIFNNVSEKLHAIRKDLDDFMSDITHKHPKFLLLWTLHHSALLQLHLPMTYIVAKSDETSQLQIECMLYCLQACRTFVSMTKSFSPDGIIFVPFTTLVDMTSMVIATSRLLLVNINGWDLEKARETIDIQVALDGLIDKITAGTKIKDERVATTAVENPSCYTPDEPDDKEQDRLRVFIKMLESIKNWYKNQVHFSERRGLEYNISDEPLRSPQTHLEAQSPQWNFTFFFESLLLRD
ncbi:hypothetical protein F5Y19DRAFT_462142 [Xylariaceae sp. FL1651]|nr:hypothetical protein F5Y19DRAFT_462142 [Xylariaceae sp. FL1651]